MKSWPAGTWHMLFHQRKEPCWLYPGPSFRCTGIPLCPSNGFCFSGTFFSKCLCEAVFRGLQATWPRICSILALSVPTKLDQNTNFPVAAFSLFSPVFLLSHTVCSYGLGVAAGRQAVWPRCAVGHATYACTVRKWLENPLVAVSAT